MSTEPNPFAALLDGVSRYYANSQDDSEGYLLPETEVLAALAAAVPADLAEAGKVLEGVTPGPWRVGPVDDCRVEDANGNEVAQIDGDYNQPETWPLMEANARFIAWCREGVPALLARIAAQEAQIKGLEAEKRYWKGEIDTVLAGRADEHDRAEAAETALTAMTKERDEALETSQSNWNAAKRYVDEIVKLNDALAAERAKTAKLVEVERAARKLEENLGVKGVDVGSLRVDLYRALAAITEAQQ